MRCSRKLTPFLSPSFCDVLTTRRHLSTTPFRANKIHPIPALLSADISTFRSQAFEAAQPASLPRGSFANLPATSRWVTPDPVSSRTTFSQSYLSPYSSTFLPTEYTNGDGTSFSRADAPLGVFLSWAKLMATETHLKTAAGPQPRLTIAQAPLSSLPPALLEDIPTPELVMKAGNGDVYADSVWLGLAPTITPLHRDPNPNLLVQIGGRKVVRMMTPKAGEMIWRKARQAVESSVGGSKMRGEEMMVGRERDLLESVVWGEGEATNRADRESVLPEGGVEMWEGDIGPGDGVFIPSGWWHAVRGVGEGAVASVNWWFR